MRVVAVETIPTDFANVDLVIRDFLDAKLEPWIRKQTSAEAGIPTAGTGVKH
jgi:hypothetical protein